MEDAKSQPPEPTCEPMASKSSRCSMVNSSELLRGKPELQISHEGEVYRLRVTRNGKLILNK